MKEAEITTEVRKRIERTVNYILNDLKGDLSLEQLASIASYSPYHYQRLFKSVTGESPKQYVIRTRLETAAHFLVIHKKKPVHVIGMECGFSSPAVFARAFKAGFGISAEEFRRLKHPGRMIAKERNDHFKKLHQETGPYPTKNTGLSIEVKKLPAQYGICFNTSFESPEKIQHALNELIVSARAHDLVTPHTQIIGIMYPHHNIYKAFLTVDPQIPVPHQFNRTEIRVGKFAIFTVQGELRQSFEVLFNFYNHWLPQNGYKLADIYGFELFSEDPSSHPYHEIERRIFVPIEPA